MSSWCPGGFRSSSCGALRLKALGSGSMKVDPGNTVHERPASDSLSCNLHQSINQGRFQNYESRESSHSPGSKSAYDAESPRRRNRSFVFFNVQPPRTPSFEKFSSRTLPKSKERTIPPKYVRPPTRCKNANEIHLLAISSPLGER